jgi:FAD-dependent monooxygenase
METLSHDTILIAGGGPVGLLVATVLAHYGVKSVILERNETTTRSILSQCSEIISNTGARWPKMDLTNGRSMELLRRLGLNEDIRKLGKNSKFSRVLRKADSGGSVGVPSTAPYNVYITPGLGLPSATTSWDFPSNEELRKEFREQNDGSMPQEPWQRISQAIFEKYLKERCDENIMIDCRFSWKIEKCIETDQGVQVGAIDLKDGSKRIILSSYLVACDGASSRVRRDMGIELDGGPLYVDGFNSPSRRHFQKCE